MVVIAIFHLTLQSVKDTVALSTSASDAIVSTAESASPALVDGEASFLKFNPGAVVVQPLGLEIRYRQLAHTGEYLVLGFAAASTAMLWRRRFERAGRSCRVKPLGAAICFCAACSLVDQSIRVFVPGREFDLLDLGFDALGYVVACVVAVAGCQVVGRCWRRRGMGGC